MFAVPSTGRPASEPAEPDWTKPGGKEEALPAGCVLSGHPSLEDIIPQIYYLAQHVGGLKRLAEIIAELQGERPE